MQHLNFYEFVKTNKGKLTWDQIGSRFNISGEAARCRWKRSTSNWVPKSKWQVQAKNGEVKTLTSWHYNQLNDTYKQEFLEAIASIGQRSQRAITRKETEVNKKCLVIGSTDFHLGLNTSTLEQQYNLALHKMYETVDKASHAKPERIYVIVGSDAIDADGYNNTTTRHTPRQLNASWHEVFKAACKLYIEFISNVASEYIVEAVVIPGNHDETLSLALGEVIGAYFAGDENIKVHNNVDEPRKVILYYNNLLTFTHGDGGKIKDLPALVASENYQLWGIAANKYFFTGHYHKGVINDDYFGNMVVTMPTLAIKDVWHKKNQYHSTRAMHSYLIDANDGIENVIIVR